MAATIADKHSPDQKNRFVGICIERNNEGLWTNFTLRNVVDKTGMFKLIRTFIVTQKCE